ncbi:MAG: DUF4922 domain-containing protein [Endozoicomonas sp.]
MSAPSPRQLQKTRLHQWLQEVSDRGLSSGALQPGETEVVIVVDGLPFEVRVLTNLRKKPKRTSNTSETRNPFLPYEQDLYVTHLESGHVVLLNKYNVVDNHLLMVTPEFEEQQSLLQRKEFAALTEVIDEFPMLAFYNSGEVAGASQAHKHLQAIPAGTLPISSALESLSDEPQTVESLPFRHRISAIPASIAPEKRADNWHALYLKMLAELNLFDSQVSNIPKPYNLLMTREWMMIVPRTRGRLEETSVNALGFAGLLLVKDRERLSQLKKMGPSELLRTVSAPT